MKLIYQSRVWEDDDEPQVEVSDVCSAPTDELINLLSEVLRTLRNRKSVQDAIGVIKREINLVTPEEVAAIGELKLKSPVICYLKQGSLRQFELSKDLPSYMMDEIATGVEFYACVELPPRLQKQVDKHKKKLAAEGRKRAAKKREREIAKAKKLLEKHGVAAG